MDLVQPQEPDTAVPAPGPAVGLGASPAAPGVRPAAAQGAPGASAVAHIGGPESVTDPVEHQLGGPDLADPAAPSTQQRRSRLRGFLGALGPGLITGAADDDPSGVATYSQAGAATGMGLLWTAPLALPLMYVVQEICDRTALATGDSLGTLIRRKFSARASVVILVLLLALLVANTLNVAADLAAVGQGMQLLHAGPDHIWAAIVGVGLTITLIAGSFERIAALFKWLCLILLAYLVVLAVAQVPWRTVGRGTLGMDMHWSWTTANLVVAVLGTTISPYMFFWQSAHRIEQMRADTQDHDSAWPLRWRRRRAARRTLTMARVDVLTGMFASTAVMFAIMVASAATIGRNGPATINTAADAAQALAPIAGRLSSVIFALGFIGTGILAIPVLAASGSIALSGMLNKDWGFNRSPRKAPVFYGLLILGTLGGILIAYLSNNPISLLVLSAVINGIAAGPFLVVVMLMAADRRLMGQYRLGPWATTFGWLTTGIMLAAGVVGTYCTLTGKS